MAVVILTFMSLAFRNVTSAPLDNLNVVAPDGTVVGIIGENGSGKSRLLGPDDALNLAPVPVLLIDRTFGQQDLVTRERAAVALDRMRRAGVTTLVVSHEEELIRRLADEVWWLQEGKLAGRGDPEEMLAKYRKHVAARLRDWGETVTPPLAPTVRRGDGRAEIVRVETIGENGRPTMVWRSGYHDPHPHRTQCVRHQHGTRAAQARSLRRRQHAGTGLCLLVRTLPGRVHAHRRVARSRWRLA